MSMRGRLGLFVGFGAGYVLGAKAGRERYEQLRRLYENLQASPAFRHATSAARDVVGTGFDQARDLASEGIEKVKEKRSGTDGHPSSLSVAPPPDYAN
jgi:hypothetical protein